MQNWTNITPVEVVTVGSAMLIVCVAPSVLAWSDTRRRRRQLARAAALEAAARAAAFPTGETAAVASFMDTSQAWDEPTVTVDADVIGAPVVLPMEAAVFEVPPDAVAEIPVAGEEHRQPTEEHHDAPVSPPTVAVAEPLQPPEPPGASAVAPEPPPAAEPAEEEPWSGDGVTFCLQDLRRVRLPNWPPTEVTADPVRSATWRDAEHLAARYQAGIGTTRLVAPEAVRASCLGAAEAEAACTRLRFYLFEALWPSTAEQAIAEAVFEVEPDGTVARSFVRRRRRPA